VAALLQVLLSQTGYEKIGFFEIVHDSDFVTIVVLERRWEASHYNMAACRIRNSFFGSGGHSWGTCLGQALTLAKSTLHEKSSQAQAFHVGVYAA